MMDQAFQILHQIWDPLFINKLRPRQNGRHFADAIFKRIFFNENVWISIEISLKFVPKGPINKIPALFQIMATSHYLKQCWLVYWRINALLGHNELIQCINPLFCGIIYMYIYTYIYFQEISWAYMQAWYDNVHISTHLKVAYLYPCVSLRWSNWPPLPPNFSHTPAFIFINSKIRGHVSFKSKCLSSRRRWRCMHQRPLLRTEIHLYYGIDK